jgi:hypothetical protein
MLFWGFIIIIGTWNCHICAIIVLFQEGTWKHLHCLNFLDIDILDLGDQWEGGISQHNLSLPIPLGHRGCLPWGSLIILLNRKGFPIKVTMIGHPLVMPILSHLPWALGMCRLRDNKANSISFIFLDHILRNCACISNNFS